jgi:hypothetical protein
VGIARDVGILRAVSNKLKETTAHLSLYCRRINSTSLPARFCMEKSK